ncbi:MAG: hypothetical protein J3K34DRAFT_164712, partial [Monoraphidium minutum]
MSRWRRHMCKARSLRSGPPYNHVLRGAGGRPRPPPPTPAGGRPSVGEGVVEAAARPREAGVAVAAAVGRHPRVVGAALRRPHRRLGRAAVDGHHDGALRVEARQLGQRAAAAGRVAQRAVGHGRGRGGHRRRRHRPRRRGGRRAEEREERDQRKSAVGDERHFDRFCTDVVCEALLCGRGVLCRLAGGGLARDRFILRASLICSGTKRCEELC